MVAVPADFVRLPATYAVLSPDRHRAADTTSNDPLVTFEAVARVKFVALSCVVMPFCSKLAIRDSPYRNKSTPEAAGGWLAVTVGAKSEATIAAKAGETVCPPPPNVIACPALATLLLSNT